MNTYWGDLHNHCGITYGFGSLENALRIAAGHLDFCGITGHAMWPDIYPRIPETEFIIDFHQEGFQKLRDHWDEVRSAIAAYNSKDFVTFQGYEIHSSKYGDHHLVSPDDNLPLIYRDSPRQLVEDCGCRAIAVPHHIGYTPGYRGISWEEFHHEISPVVEVCSKHGCSMRESAPFPYYHDMGPRDSRNTVWEGLQQGRRFSFVGSTDHHAGFPGSYGDGLAAVLAEEKTRESIFGAICKGRTYAVTGDRILCQFQVNGSDMGSVIRAGESRLISGTVDACYWPDKLVLYRNQKPIHIINGEALPIKRDCGKYKIRVEMGWGNSDGLFRWEGEVKTDGGRIRKTDVCWRGRNVLSPTNQEDSSFDHINRIDNRVTCKEGNRFAWICETVKNKSTLHPQTDAVILEVEGSPDTLVTFQINGKTHSKTIASLLERGFSEHLQPWHSHAYKVHTAIPLSAYAFSWDFHDQHVENSCDVYHVEISQQNGHWAFLSPVYVLSD